MSATLQTNLAFVLSIGFIILLILSIISAIIAINILMRLQRVSRKIESGLENWPKIVRDAGLRAIPVVGPALAGAFWRQMRRRRRSKYDDD